MQAVLLAEGMKARPVQAVYASDLSRSIQTAAYLSETVRVLPGFREMDCGEWEGLDFAVIRKRWPQIYEERGKNRSLGMPGAEDPKEGRLRFQKALSQALQETEGDVAIVSHAAISKTFLCDLLGYGLAQYQEIDLAYASVTTLVYDGSFHVLEKNEALRPKLDQALCMCLLDAAGTPVHVQKHSMAVASFAREICKELRRAGVELNETLVETAALLHDIARMEANHAAAGGEYLRRLGYEAVASLVEVHHDCLGEELDEASVLAIADRCVWEEERVSLEERFTRSRSKCVTPEAKEKHDRRYKSAVHLKKQVNERCGKEIIR